MSGTITNWPITLEVDGLGRAFIGQLVILSRVAKEPDLTFFREERLPLDNFLG